MEKVSKIGDNHDKMMISDDRLLLVAFMLALISAAIGVVILVLLFSLQTIPSSAQEGEAGLREDVKKQ
jgi:hypothetical protein